MPKILLVAAALAVAPGIAFAGDTQTAAVQPTVVEIHNLKFDPPTLTIAPGTKVTWVNEDSSLVLLRLTLRRSGKPDRRAPHGAPRSSRGGSAAAPIPSARRDRRRLG